MCQILPSTYSKFSFFKKLPPHCSAVSQKLCNPARNRFLLYEIKKVISFPFRCDRFMVLLIEKLKIAHLELCFFLSKSCLVLLQKNVDSFQMSNQDTILFQRIQIYLMNGYRQSATSFRRDVNSERYVTYVSLHAPKNTCQIHSFLRMIKFQSSFYGRQYEKNLSILLKTV